MPSFDRTTMLDFDTIRLGSTYKRYKLGTKKLKNFLCETSIFIARRNCNGEGLPSNENPSSGDLLRLAKFISRAQPKVTVPLAILLCAKDVIQGRTLCASFYQQFEHADTKTGEAFMRMNRSHKHFITVLEDIQAYLKGLEVESAGKPPERPSKRSAAVGKKPTFDVLELEEPSDALDDTASVPRKTPRHDNPVAASKPLDPTPTFSLEEDVEMEESFAIFCAFQDIRAIRLHVQAVWKGFYNGEISFLVAIEITKAAFPMIEDISHALSDASPWIRLYDDISNYLGLESSMGDGETIFFFNKLGKNLPEAGLRDLHGNIVSIRELFCAPAYSLMHDFRLYSRAQREPANENLRIRGSTHPLAGVLRNVEPTIRLMADQVGDKDYGLCSVRGFVIVTVTESLVYANKYGGFTISGVANCQILMDIVDALGMMPQVGYNILQDTLARESDSARLEKYADGFGSPHAHLTTHEDTTAQAAIHALKVTLSHLRGDEVANGQRGLPSGRPLEMTGTHKWPSDRHPEDLLTSLPLLSGLRLSLLFLGRCWYSAQQANQISLLGAAYVYRAARAFGLVHRPWHDMDSLINSQSMHGSYVLDASSIEGYARHFDIAIGVPLASFGSDNGRGVFQTRSTVPSAAKIAAKMKKLKPASSFMWSLEEVAGMEGVVDRRQYYESLHLTAQRVYNTKRQNSLTPLELLNALQKSLLEDEVYLKFDYGRFSMRCQAMFITASKKYQHYMASGAGDVEDALKLFGNVEISEQVHAALWEAAELEKMGASLRIKTESKLGRIARIIQQTIEVDPDSWLSIARHGSSGHLADLEAPCRRWKWGGPSPVFGPITPQEHLKRQRGEKCMHIQNNACAYFNKLQLINIPHEDRVARVKSFIDQQLLEAGITGLEMGHLKVVPEYRTVSIGWKKKTHPAQDAKV